MMISSVPICFPANANGNGDNLPVNGVQTEEKKAVQVEELEDQRDIYSKTYETSEGTNVAISSSLPIHYEDNGQLVEIDNTLVKSEKDDTVYTNKSNPYDVELPETLNSSAEVSLNYNSSPISFKLIGDILESTLISVEKYNKNEVDEFDVESVAYSESNLDCVISTATYKNILDNTDIEYTVTPETLKENIILNKCPANDFSIRYELNAEGCSVNLNNDNSISIISENAEIYKIESPYMFDSDGDVTDDIAVSLEKTSNVYIISYTPNNEWLRYDDTSYPVTIDPTIKVVSNSSNKAIEDTFVTTSTKTKNKSTMSTVTVQTATSDNWGYYDINYVPELPDNSRITNCTLNLHTITDIANPCNIALYTLPDDTVVAENFISKLTWNNKVLPLDTAIDMAMTSKTANQLSFDITALANKWIQNPDSNRILVLKSFDGSSKASIASSEYTSNASYAPYVSFEYTTVGGIDNNYSYHTQDVGLAGIAHINDYTGNMVIERTDFSSKASAKDIKLYLNNNNVISKTTSTNYNRTIQFDTINNYVITYGDGHKHYISSDDNMTVDTSVKNEITVLYSEGTNNYKDRYSRSVLSSNIDKTDQEAVFALIEHAKQKNGHIKSDSSYSTVNITYQNDKISSISDEITSFIFEYQNGVLYSITAEPAFSDESVLSENSDNYIGTNKNVYEYEANKTIAKLYGDNDMSQPGVIVNYTYDVNGNVTSISDNHGIKYLYEYNDNNQVVKVQEYAGEIAGDYLTFSYGADYTVISDGKKTVTEYFDNSGKLMSIIDQDGNAIFSQYKGDLISKISKTRNSARNIADFYGFESNKDTFFTTNNGNVSITSGNKHSGKSSLELTSSVGNTAVFSNVINNLKPNTTYTVSMWIKSNDASKCKLELTNGDTSGVFVAKIAQDIDGWQQLYCTLNTDDSGYINTRIFVDNSTINSPIKVYIDDMYIQQSPYLTNVNLLNNSDFIEGLNSWTTDTEGNCVETLEGNIATADTKRLKLIGNVNETNEIFQIVNISAPKGTKFNYGGWVKAVNALPERDNTGRELSVSVYAISADTSETLLGTVKYSTCYSNWQYIEDEITLPDDFGDGNEAYTALKFVLKFNNQNGTAYVDGLSLSKDELYTAQYLYGSSNEIIGIGIGETVIPIDNEAEDLLSSINATESIEYDEYGNIHKTNTHIDVNVESEDVSKTVTRYIAHQFDYSNGGSLIYKTTNPFGNWIDYKYDFYGNITYYNDEFGRVTEYEYDNFQNLVSIIKSFDSVNYTDDIEKIKERCNDNESTEQLKPSEKTTLTIKYSYDGKRLNKIETLSASSEDLENCTIVNSYEFEYDIWGNLSAVYVNDAEHKTPFIKYIYDSEKYRQLNSVSYINGQQINYIYDDNGNVIYTYDTSNIDGSTLSYSYYYYDNGDCYGKKNLITGTIETYQDGLTTICDAEGNITYSYGEDVNGKRLQQIGDNYVSTVQTGETQTIIVNGKTSTITRTYDDFGRLATERMHTNNSYPDLVKIYLYYAHGETFTEKINDDNILNGKQETSNIVRSIQYFYCINGEYEEVFTNNYLYWFDESMATSTHSSNQVRLYAHNSAGMLLNSDRVLQGEERTYTYNSNGNIEKVHGETQSGSSVPDLTQVSERNTYYSYDNNSGTSLKNCLTRVQWYDVNIDTKAETLSTDIHFSYDSLGNLSSVLNDDATFTFNWCRGNVLGGINITKNTYGTTDVFANSVVYQYDDNNLRTKKAVNLGNNNSFTVEYIWENSKLMGTNTSYVSSTDENAGDYNTVILYDFNGNAYGFVLNRTKDNNGSTVNDSMLFYYIKDINNTIIAVVSEDGEVADAFEYDDFGMPIQRDYADFAYLSALNPLMYRDYIYDFESQMYYVKSRYYMPAVSRYANADLSFGRDNHTILSTNLYLYCDNDPINKTAK